MFRALPIVFLLAGFAPAVLGQEKLYPVRGNRDTSLVFTSDRLAVVVEKAFQHKLTLGSPTDERASFLDGTRAPLVALWLRVQNVSQRPMQLDISKFTSVDDQGRTYPLIAPDDAVTQIMEGASSGSIGTKTLRGISLGRAGTKPGEEQIRGDIERYSLHSGPIAAGATQEGLIYFQRPPQKKFTVKITLGDLWGQPLVFSTEKQK